MYNILYILIYSESAVLQAEKVLKKFFYAEKPDFFKIFYLFGTTLARCLLLWLAENKKFSGCLKILRSEQLLFQRSMEEKTASAVWRVLRHDFKHES